MMVPVETTSPCTAEAAAASSSPALIPTPTETWTSRPKYFHQLLPPPLDLPEVICLIRSHLTIQDLKKCTLVCFTWCKQFRPFLWESLYYSRLEIDPALKRHGPLIRQLYTHSLQDKDLRSIAKLCPNLTGIELEIESLQDPGSIFEVFASVSHSLQRLTIRLLNPSSTGNVQRALLEPIAWGRLSLLTELRLMGFGYDCYAPLYTTGMLLRCVEGCPLLETLEISGVRLVQSQSQWDAVVQKAFNNTNRNALESNVRPLPQQGQQQVNASFWRSYKKTNILGRLVAAVLPSAPSQQESGATPATFTSTLDTPQSPTSPTSPAASSASALPHSPATVLPVPVEVETIEPLRDYTCKFLRTLKLSDIFTDTKTGMAFTSELLNRCPNLAYLYLKVAPVELQDLAILCPKLRTFAVENYQEYTMTYPQPPLSAYLNPRSLEGLHDDHTLLMALRSVKLNHCVIRDEELTAIHQDFKRYRLKHLQITNCFSITSLGLARFLAECWALESLWVDRLLLPVVGTNVLAHRSRSRSVGDGGQPGTTGTSNGSGAGSVVHVNPNAIQWGCGQIRYLDVNGPQGHIASFEHIFLDLVSRLDHLECLGIGTNLVAWLMECEPVLYNISQEGQKGDGLETTQPRPGVDEPLPLGMFRSVKTLSLEATCRNGTYFMISGPRVSLSLEQVKYLYDAFPALERIVHNSPIFPCQTEAWDWLKNTPRRITVEHQSRKDLERAVMGS